MRRAERTPTPAGAAGLDQRDQWFGFRQLGIHDAAALNQASQLSVARARDIRRGTSCPGMGMPAVTDAIFSCEVASACAARR